MPKSRILFAAYGASHIRTLLPVITSLQSREDVQVKVLALTTARATAENAGCETVGFADLWRDGDDRARELGAELAKDMDTAIVAHEESVAYMGLSYAELERREGIEVASELFAAKGRGAFLPIDTVGRLLDDFRPDLVVATNSPRAERASIEAAGKRGIASLALGDLFVMESWPWMARNGYATRIAVLGEWVKRRLISKGRDADDIVVTGNPGLDHLAAAHNIEAGKRLRQAFGWQDRRVLTWALASIRPSDEALVSVAAKVELLKRMTNRDTALRVVIRPHPNQQLDFGELNSSFRISGRDEDIVSLVHASDMVMTEFSMVGFEAALLGKPVVAIGRSGQLPYQELGLAREVSDLMNLEAALQEAADMQLQPRMDLLGAPPLGESTGRVIAEIEDLLSR